MQHENAAIGSGNLVQTRLESIASISKRQNEDLYNVAYNLTEVLARLRGEIPKANKAHDNPAPCGLIAEIELSLQNRDEAISLLSEIERELRSLI
jgi:hypothetical protein